MACKIILLLFLLQSIAYAQNFSGWTHEKDGIKLQLFTEKKEYLLGDKLQLHVRIMNTSRDQDYTVKYVLLYRDNNVFRGELSNTWCHYSFSVADRTGKVLPYRAKLRECLTHPFNSPLYAPEDSRHQRLVSEMAIKPGKYQDFLLTRDLNEYVNLSEAGAYTLSADIFLPLSKKATSSIALFRTPVLRIGLKAPLGLTPPSDKATTNTTDHDDWIPIPIPDRQKPVFGVVVDKISLSKKELSGKLPNDMITVKVTLKNTGNKNVAVEDWGMFDMALWRKTVRRMQFPKLLMVNLWPLSQLLPLPYQCQPDKIDKLLAKIELWPEYNVIQPHEKKCLTLLLSPASTGVIPEDTKAYDCNDSWEISLSRKLFHIPGVADYSKRSPKQMEACRKWLVLPPIIITQKDFPKATVIDNMPKTAFPPSSE